MRDTRPVQTKPGDPAGGIHVTFPYAQTLALLDHLVGFPTVSADSNLQLISFAEAQLRQAGFETRRIPDATGTKAGLLARSGPGTGGVMLSAHSDVVPVAGQQWTREPFRLVRDGGRLYGRGTTDMKGFLASMLSCAQRAGQKDLRKPLMLCISFDEEVGCTGIRQMLPAIRDLDWRPDLCIVGEPTGMRPAIGHKGKAAFSATCIGSSGHSALAPKYVNALHLAADVIGILRRIQDGYATGAQQDADYAISYSTVHVGRMQGGTALNIVPDRASLEFELRHLAGDSVSDFMERLDQDIQTTLAAWRRIEPAADIVVQITNRYPGLALLPDDLACRQVAAFCGEDRPIKVAYGTEAGYLSQLGIPTVVCGPGDMEAQGHKADEFVEVAQLAACDRMLDRVLDSLA